MSAQQQWSRRRRRRQRRDGIHTVRAVSGAVSRNWATFFWTRMVVMKILMTRGATVARDRVAFVMPPPSHANGCFLSTADHQRATATMTATRTTRPKVLQRASHNNNNNNNNNPSSMSIPVLGPIPNQGPLLLGEELVLSPPLTPLQWWTLQEVVLIHQKEQQNEQSQQQSQRQANIEAAPLVALLPATDWLLAGPITATTTTKTNHQPAKQQQKYATLAAVIGMSWEQDDEEEEDDHETTMTTATATTTATPTATAETKNYPWNAKVRLVGVGRAVLSDFVYQRPTTSHDGDEDSMAYLTEAERDQVKRALGQALVNPYSQQNKNSYDTVDSSANRDDKDDADWDDDDDDASGSSWAHHHRDTNILWAQFGMMQDHDTVRGLNGYTRQQQQQFQSPVHALAHMSTWASRLQFLHQDRQRLVAGLLAGRARLQHADGNQNHHDGQSFANRQLSSLTTNNDHDKWDHDLQDYDGIGKLFEHAYRQAEQEHGASPTGSREPHQQSADWESSNAATYNTAISTATTATSSRYHTSLRQQQESQALASLSQMQNFGMGYSAASFASLPTLTRQAMEQTLAPYYSPEWQQQEESYYQVYSFVAVQSLQAFLPPNDTKKSAVSRQLASWSCHECTSTQERMEGAYHVMMEHVQLLQHSARQMNRSLLECGEECTDLW